MLRKSGLEHKQEVEVAALDSVVEDLRNPNAHPPVKGIKRLTHNLVQWFRRWSPKHDRSTKYVISHFHVSDTFFVLNYWGRKQHNIEDIQGLRMALHGFRYENNIWSMNQLLKRLKKDLIYCVLRQMGSTLNIYLSHKLGISMRGGPHESVPEESDSEPDSVEVTV